MAYVSTLLRQVLVINQIITIHYFEYAPQFDFKGESHAFWEMVCVDSGEVEIGADGEMHEITGDMVVFHKPMEFHTIRSLRGTAPNLLIISFESASPAMRFFEKKKLRLEREDKELLSQIVIEAERAFSTPLNVPSVEKVERAPDAPLGAEQLIKMYLEILLINMIRREQATRLVQPVKIPKRFVPRAEAKNGETLQGVMVYLAEHIGEDIPVAKIASDNLVGRSQLQAMFHQEFGCGVIDAFCALKIARAKNLIREGGKSLTEISYLLGYSSLPYFSRQFKKITGLPPSEYARTIKSISEKTSRVLPQEKEVSRGL